MSNPASKKPSNALGFNCRNWHAVLLHKPCGDNDKLNKQLNKLGITTSIHWPELTLSEPRVDILFFDGDMAYDGIFPWQPEHSPIPTVAVMGSESPGRLEWLIRHQVNATLFKPIQSRGVFSAMYLAHANFQRNQQIAADIKALESKISKRSQVLHVLLEVIQKTGLSEEHAFAVIRSKAMSKQTDIESFCDSVAVSDSLLSQVTHEIIADLQKQQQQLTQKGPQ